MYELFKWIDKGFEFISKSELFLTYFSDTLIEEIEGTLFLDNQKKGIDIIFSDKKTVNAIHLNSGDYLAVGRFAGDLPYDLKFTYSKKQVRNILGIPNVTSGKHKIIAFGGKSSWDKYFYNTFSLHVQYNEQENHIQMITIESKTFEEYSMPE